MKERSRSQVLGAWRFYGWVGATLVVLAVFVVLLSSDLTQEHRTVVSALGLVGSGVFAAASCGRRSRQSIGRRKRAWAFLALSGLIGALGSAWVIVTSITAIPDGWSGAGQLGFLVSLLFGLAAMIIFPSVPRRGNELVRMVLDGIVFGGSALFVSSVTVFPLLLSGGEVPLGSRVLTLLQPLLDFVAATLAVLMILRSSRRDRPALALVSAGFIVFAFSDIYFAVLTARNDFSFGTPLDTGWMIGFAFIGLAARHLAASAGHHPDVPKQASPVVGTVVIFIQFLGAAQVGFVARRDSDFSVATAVLWLLVLLAVATRQVILIVDNDRLRRDLERRVFDRTGDLRQLTRQRELLLSSVADGIYGVDRDGLVTFVNPAAAQTLGYGPDDLIGVDAHATFHAEREDGMAFPPESCYINEAIREGAVSTAEEDVYHCADGHRIPVEVTASPLGDDSVTHGAVVVFRDITQRLEVDRLKTEFISVVSHELRTPLTSIRGSLGLLSGGALGVLPRGASRLVDLALDSSERLTRLINDILDVERIESGAMPMDLSDHSARMVVEAAIAQVDVIAAEAGVTVSTSSLTGRVHADADRVIQTLLNLLGNAIKFSPSGSEVIVTAAPCGSFVQFSVSDHGRGIPVERLDAIFHRFEQVDSSDARDKGGTGLGLAISRSLVERLGGQIWAESNPSRGSTFRFTLPGVAESATTDDSTDLVGTNPALRR